MEILDRTAGRLVIGYNQPPWRRWLFFGLTFSMLVYIAATALAAGTTAGMSGVEIALIVLSALPAAYFGLKRVSEEWHFDVATGTLTIVRRSLLFRSERAQPNALADIAKVTLQEKASENDGMYALRLRLRSGKTLKMDSAYDRCEHAPELAQTISSFTGIPLDVRQGLLWWTT